MVVQKNIDESLGLVGGRDAVPCALLHSARENFTVHAEIDLTNVRELRNLLSSLRQQRLTQPIRYWRLVQELVW